MCQCYGFVFTFVLAGLTVSTCELRCTIPLNWSVYTLHWFREEAGRGEMRAWCPVPIKNNSVPAEEAACHSSEKKARNNASAWCRPHLIINVSLVCILITLLVLFSKSFFTFVPQRSLEGMEIHPLSPQASGEVYAACGNLFSNRFPLQAPLSYHWCPVISWSETEVFYYGGIALYINFMERYSL